MNLKFVLGENIDLSQSGVLKAHADLSSICRPTSCGEKHNVNGLKRNSPL